MLYRYFLALLLLGAAGVADAATLYQWKDEAGVTHFTDNPANVPPQYRQKGERQVKGLRASTGPAGPGEQIWREKCLTCHHLGTGIKDRDGKPIYGMHDSLINGFTGFPFSPEDVKDQMQMYLKGKSSNMPAIELSDEEQDQLSRYLSNAVSR